MLSIRIIPLFNCSTRPLAAPQLQLIDSAVTPVLGQQLFPSGELQIVAGVPPTLSANLSNTTVNLTWPICYSPNYLLQQQVGPTGLGSGSWQDILPNTYGSRSFGPIQGSPPTFYRLITP